MICEIHCYLAHPARCIGNDKLFHAWKETGIIMLKIIGPTYDILASQICAPLCLLGLNQMIYSVDCCKGKTVSFVLWHKRNLDSHTTEDYTHFAYHKVHIILSLFPRLPHYTTLLNLFSRRRRICLSLFVKKQDTNVAFGQNFRSTSSIASHV